MENYINNLILRKKMLTRFLKEYNIYVSYVENSKKLFNEKKSDRIYWATNVDSIDDVINNCIEGNNDSEIRNCFVWDKTKERFKFWEKYAIIYEDMINMIKNETKNTKKKTNLN